MENNYNINDTTINSRSKLNNTISNEVSKKNGKSKKKTIIFAIIAGYLLLIITLFLMWYFIFLAPRTISKKEYKEYLIDKYGDLDFEYVSSGTCNFLNLGYCEYYFTTPEMNGKIFLVDGRFENNKKVFTDYYNQPERYK